ncbi:hypothetical protein DEF28_26755, partial [Marinitenerispora sediminis]
MGWGMVAVMSRRARGWARIAAEERPCRRAAGRAGPGDVPVVRGRPQLGRRRLEHERVAPLCGAGGEGQGRRESANRRILVVSPPRERPEGFGCIPCVPDRVPSFRGPGGVVVGADHGGVRPDVEGFAGGGVGAQLVGDAVAGAIQRPAAVPVRVRKRMALLTCRWWAHRWPLRGAG